MSSEVEIEQTWLKVERESRKAGLREGISAGRESNFQDGFDEGYKEGFKNGFTLGKLKGEFRAISNTNTPNAKLGQLNKTTQALCLLCQSDDIEKENLDEVKVQQGLKVNQVVQELEVLKSTT